MQPATVCVFLTVCVALCQCYLSPISLYRSTLELERNITILAQTHPAVRHEACRQDKSIRYVTIGEGDLTAIISCNVHAHELITAEICLDLANKLAQTNALLELDKVLILYAPNPNREDALRGDYCLRTNQNGIDLNRNFPYGFEVGGGETYGGETPLSESYSQCLDQLARDLKPLVYLDVHSGEFSLVYSQPPEGSDPSEPILRTLKHTFCRNCRLADVVTLKIHGQAFEYMKYELGVRYSSLLEVYGGYKAQLPWNELCLAIFNPLSVEQLEYYRSKWTQAILDYLRLVAEAQ